MRLLSEIKDRLRGEPNLKVLKRKGLSIGKNFSYGHYCFFDPAHCFLITIGDDVTFSTRVHLLCHDASIKKYVGYTKIGRIDIGDHAFIGANVTVLPGVTIGSNSIVGAGSVVTKNIEAGMVYAGVPAKKLCAVKEYIERFDNIEKMLIFGEEYTFRGGITEEKKIEMKEKLQNGKIGFVR